MKVARIGYREYDGVYNQHNQLYIIIPATTEHLPSSNKHLE